MASLAFLPSRWRGGAFGVIYLATVRDAVYVLHAFQKKAMKTPGARSIWRERGWPRCEKRGGA